MPFLSWVCAIEINKYGKVWKLFVYWKISLRHDHLSNCSPMAQCWSAVSALTSIRSTVGRERSRRSVRQVSACCLACNIRRNEAGFGRTGRRRLQHNFIKQFGSQMGVQFPLTSVETLFCNCDTFTQIQHIHSTLINRFIPRQTSQPSSDETELDPAWPLSPL